MIGNYPMRPMMNSGVGGGGLADLAGGGNMGGYRGYLEGLGWNGAPGTRFDFAQGLRNQGQHPFMDYWHSMNPQGATQGNGGGINPGSYDGSGINPGRVFTGGSYGPPHTVAPPTMGGSYGGLGSLALRPPFGQR